MRVKLTIAVTALAVLALAACSTTPDVMRYHPDRNTVDFERVWPAAPELPRYRFAGELRGEQNFGPSEQNRPGTGERFLRWLVGLGAKLRGNRREMVRPQSGTVDGNGRIYVTDVGNAGIFVFDEANGKLHIWKYVDRFVKFSTPIGITTGAQGEILVADADLARVVRLDLEGNPLGDIGQNQLSRPTGLAYDPATARTYVADTRDHLIKVFDKQGRLVQRIGRRGEAPGEFNAPTHLALVDNRLYVADTLNARVQVLQPDGTPIASFGERGLYVGNLTRPKGVVADDDGNVYVIESYYDHMLVFDDRGRFLLPIGGTGDRVGQFFLPAGIWRDRRGRIFVADMFNGRVVIFQYLGT